MRSDSQDVAGGGRPLLLVEDGRLGYRGQVVLRDVDLTIRAGEYWFVLGPNGAGKTTLLHTLLGLLPPLAGRVERDPVRAALARTGFVPQRCSFSPALPTSVREFVSLGRIRGDRTRAQRDGDLAWALERAGLVGMEDRDYWSLSGGQRQRALVARALARRPSLLVLDEPTEGMDIGSQHAFFATLEALHREAHSTLVFVTHQIEVAGHYATHVALAHQGRVVAGARDRVLEPGLLVRAFGERGEVAARGLAAERRAVMGSMRELGDAS